MTCGRTIAADKVTILYHAPGDSKTLTKDWEFSAQVEHDGRRILFDTGSSAATLVRNEKTAEQQRLIGGTDLKVGRYKT